MKSGETTIFNPFSKNGVFHLLMDCHTRTVISQDHTNMEMFKSFVEEKKI